MSFKKVTVAGGGVLGSQIAFQTAFKGFDVTVWLRSDASIERAKPKFENLKNTYLTTLEYIKANIGKSDLFVPAGFSNSGKNITEEEVNKLVEDVNRAYDSIVLTTDLKEAFSDADFVIEAVAETNEQKIEFYEKIREFLKEDTILATNSSTLLPSTFRDATGRPEKFLALHFANRIWQQNTGEVMGHDTTSKEAFEKVAEFAEEIGMVPLRVNKEQPGYLLNSLLVPFLNSALVLAATEVASPKDIDAAWTIGTSAPNGPFRILDVVGLATPLNILKNNPDSNKEGHPLNKAVKMLEKMIEEGRTGVAAGKGFYEYVRPGSIELKK